MHTNMSSSQKSQLSGLNNNQNSLENIQKMDTLYWHCKTNIIKYYVSQLSEIELFAVSILANICSNQKKNH